MLNKSQLLEGKGMEKSLRPINLIVTYKKTVIKKSYYMNFKLITYISSNGM